MPTIFEDDNGGRTSKGVSDTEIRVAWAMTGTSDATRQQQVTALFDYFNRNFEFYGRRLVPSFPVVSTSDVVNQRAEAAAIAAEDVFAAFDNPQWSALPAFFQELARQGVVSVMAGGTQGHADRDLFDAWHPYVWSVYPSIEQIGRNLGSLVCSSLAGRPASHGGPAVAATTRKFGIVATGRVRTPWIQPLIDVLGACDAPVETAVVPHQGDGTTWSNGLTTAAERFRQAGVTTMICACADFLSSQVMNAIERTGWASAEWLLPSFNNAGSEEYFVQSTTARARVFGLQPHPRVMPLPAQWWFRAVIEALPTFQERPYWLSETYDKLLLLAAGIQAAGPALTPETFGQGLLSVTFDNRGAGQSPDWLPAIGFGPGDHSFYNDYALAWWSETAEAQGDFAKPNGSWCYLDGGARYEIGNWPAGLDQRFFSPKEPCR